MLNFSLLRKVLNTILKNHHAELKEPAKTFYTLVLLMELSDSVANRRFHTFILQ